MTVYGTVAKDVPRDKWKTIPKAMEAVAAEWARLRAQNVWDEAHPRTLGSVQSEAKRNNKTIHIGRLFDLCVEKHNELAVHLRKARASGRCTAKHETRLEGMSLELVQVQLMEDLRAFG